jgi:hypothetical protein
MDINADGEINENAMDLSPEQLKKIVLQKSTCLNSINGN